MQLYASYWVTLPQRVRERMRDYFGIKRSTGTIVDGGRVVSDGSTDLDLGVVTKEKMQELLGKGEAPFEMLLQATIEHFSSEIEALKTLQEQQEQAEYESVQEAEQKSLADVVEAVVSTVAKRRGGRPLGSKNKK